MVKKAHGLAITLRQCDNAMETLLGIVIGVGLSAACGFRVFVPLLVMNLMAISGHLDLSPGFEWIGTPYATVAFAVATLVEILAYYIPLVDHALDVAAAPAAVIAGTVAAASVADLSPFLKWTLALIAGGGIAGLVQATTSALRVKSSLFTAASGNALLATLELVGAAVIALLAILAPLLVIVLIGFFILLAVFKASRFLLRRSKWIAR